MTGYRRDWFRHRAVGDGVHLIWEPYVGTYLRPNIWLIEGRDRALLVDSGMGVVPLAPTIASLTGKPVLCLSTHCHFDHVGGAHEFADRLSHPAEAEILASPDWRNVTVEGWVDDGTFAELPYPGFRPADYAVRPCAPTRPVDEGDIVDLGDRHFEVLHMPGHSPGSIALLERRTGILFSGDLIYQGTLLDAVYHSNKADYLESMARVRELPVATAHAGHYPSFGRDRLRELADEYIAGRRAPGCPTAPDPGA